MTRSMRLMPLSPGAIVWLVPAVRPPVLTHFVPAVYPPDADAADIDRAVEAARDLLLQHRSADTPAAEGDGTAGPRATRLPIRRVTAIMLLAAAVLDLTRCGLVVGTVTQAGAAAGLVSVGLAIPIIVTYLEEGVVPRLPTAVLSMGLMILAVLSVSSGLVLDTVTRGRREMKLLAYLSQAPINRN